LLIKWEAGREQQVVAEILGLDAASYSRFKNGVRKPPTEIALRIENITGGRVRVEHWYQLPRSVAMRRAS
jgi:DNA-binding transcriptional regulator YdaS (Cro superfamily)